MKKDIHRFAASSFWRNRLFEAYSCACNILLTNKHDGVANSIVYEIAQSKFSTFPVSPVQLTKAKIEQPSLMMWEIIGPLACGKLEIDADASMSAYREWLRNEMQTNIENECQQLLSKKKDKADMKYTKCVRAPHESGLYIICLIYSNI